jgi:hypothetical protein
MATFLTKPLINPSIVSRRASTAPSKLSWAGLRADFVKAGRKKKPTHQFGDTIYSIHKTPNPEGQQKLFNLKQSTRSMFQRDKKIILANAPKKKSGIMNFFSRRDPKVKKEIKELKNTAKKNFREQEKKILQEADAADAVQYGIKQKAKAAKATVAAVPVATPKAAQVATVPAASPKAAQVATVPVATPKAATVPVATVLASPVSVPGKFEVYAGTTDPHQLAVIRRYYAEAAIRNKKLGIPDDSPRMKAFLNQYGNQTFANSAERARIMNLRAPSKGIFVGGARKTTSKNKNKQRTHKKLKSKFKSRKHRK